MLLSVTRDILSLMLVIICLLYSDNVWRASATRSEDLQSLVNKFSRNKDLKRSFRLKNFGVKINGKEKLDAVDKRCQDI